LFSPKDVRCVEVEKPCIMKSDEVLVKVKAWSLRIGYTKSND